MWKSLKAIADAVDRLCSLEEKLLNLHQAGITEQAREVKALQQKVAELERDLRKPLHDAQLLVERAESKFRTARSAEERARRYAAEARDPEDEYDDEEDPGAFGTEVGPGSGGARVQPVPDVVPVRPPADSADLARAAKWSR